MWSYLLDNGRIAWKDVWVKIHMTLEREAALLWDFDWLWGARNVICFRVVMNVTWSLQRS